MRHAKIWSSGPLVGMCSGVKMLLLSPGATRRMVESCPASAFVRMGFLKLPLHQTSFLEPGSTEDMETTVTLLMTTPEMSWVQYTLQRKAQIVELVARLSVFGRIACVLHRFGAGFADLCSRKETDACWSGCR